MRMMTVMANTQENLLILSLVIQTLLLLLQLALEKEAIFINMETVPHVRENSQTVSGQLS